MGNRLIGKNPWGGPREGSERKEGEREGEKEGKFRAPQQFSKVVLKLMM